MKKTMISILILLTTSLALAEVNQKVRTKEINIINQKVKTKDIQIINQKVKTKDVQVINQKVQTKELEILKEATLEPTIIVPNAIPVEQATIIEEEAPAVPPIYEKETEVAAIETKEEKLEKSNDLPDLQLGARLGATAPGTGLAVDLTFLPIDMGNNNAMYTRIGLVSEQNSKHSLLALHLNEHYHIPLGSSFEGYGGLGLNIPLSKGSADDAGIGMNLIFGIEDKIDFLADKAEKIFIETGINSVSINDKSKAAFNLLGGYKIIF